PGGGAHPDADDHGGCLALRLPLPPASAPRGGVGRSTTRSGARVGVPAPPARSHPAGTARRLPNAGCDHASSAPRPTPAGACGPATAARLLTATRSNPRTAATTATASGGTTSAGIVAAMRKTPAPYSAMAAGSRARTRLPTAAAVAVTNGGTSHSPTSAPTAAATRPVVRSPHHAIAAPMATGPSQRVYPTTAMATPGGTGEDGPATRTWSQLARSRAAIAAPTSAPARGARARSTMTPALIASASTDSAT